MKFNVPINAVQTGQKSTISDPRLIANSTQGKFQITGSVSKALNISVGENVEFFNNIIGLEKLIQEPTEDVLTYCKERGINIETVIGKQQFISENTIWYIAKGHQQFDSQGNALKISVKWNKNDKLEAIKQYGSELIQDEKFREILLDRLNVDEATDEELIAAIKSDDILPPKVEKFSGSKTCTPTFSTGVGCLLSFTDTTIWKILKKDLGEDKGKMNRIFNVLLQYPETVKVFNGYKLVDVTIYPIEFFKDVTPMAKNVK